MNQHYTLNWRYYAVCIECGWKKYAPFASIFHANVKCCPNCGLDENDFELKKMRLNSSKVKWFNPFTWDDHYWETFKK